MSNIQDTVQSWISSIDSNKRHSLQIESYDSDSHQITLSIGKPSKLFSIVPDGSRFSVFSDDEDLQSWLMDVSEVATRRSVTLVSLLESCSSLYDTYFGCNANDGDDDDGFPNDNDGDDDGFPSDDGVSESDDDGITLEELDAMPQSASNNNHTDEEELPGVSRDVFEHTMDGLRERFKGGKGTKQATERLLRDFAVVQHTNTSSFGYEANPIGEDLYRWEVRFINFEGEMQRDLERFAQATGKPACVILEMTFGADYPISPPFIRVVRPRFAFRTAHVTIGGSICMELLTRSGWSPCNDIDGILVQIRAEMVAGNARLDSNFRSSDYTESEARAAFARVARDHGWEK